MVHEISPICNFLFGSIRTNLLTYLVDVELMVQMVKGIYTYRKDHTTESMTFIPWNKKVTPFPSLRHKIQPHQANQRNEKVLQWGNTLRISAPPVTQTNPRKRTPGKIRARWSNKARYNPIKTKRPNTLDVPVTTMDMTDSDK